ncbi:uncharacterized protein LOC142802755 isoform X2 [Rhipicephalus microplus]|uniref:uncharacterized protein LOC142802755 isoform X2 n=1 Tax=Rhipicephalus microplus TaxID=6941 RepID=UPI003F6B6F28
MVRRPKLQLPRPNPASNFFFAGSSAMGAHSKTHKEGIIFDIIYGLGSVLNLVSDVWMIRALRKPSEAKVKFRLFLIWNTFTTGAYYVTDLFLSSFNSKHIKLEEEHLQDMDEESARHTILFASVLISTAVFLVKGGILYAFYQMYQNYDQVVANEEARIHGSQRAIEPAVGYLFQPVNRLIVPAVAAGPAPLPAPSTSEFQMATPCWSSVPSSTHELTGQSCYVVVQQPRPPGQQQAPTQPQFNPPGETPGAVQSSRHVQRCTGDQPQLTVVDQSEIAPSPAGIASTADGPASIGSPSDKWTTQDTPLTRASSSPDARARTSQVEAMPCEGQVAAGSRSSAPTLTSGTLLPMAHDPCAEVKAAEDASGQSVYTSAVVAREKLDGRKAPARNFHASPVSGSHTDAPGPSDAHA